MHAMQGKTLGTLLRNEPVLLRFQEFQNPLLHDAPLVVFLALQQDLDALGITVPSVPSTVSQVLNRMRPSAASRIFIPW
jgi:hypothetical protein